MMEPLERAMTSAAVPAFQQSPSAVLTAERK